jgi:hypothetical protein
MATSEMFFLKISRILKFLFQFSLGFFLVATVRNFASKKQKTLRDWTSKPEATIPEASYVTSQSRSPNSHESSYLKSVDWVTGAGNPR